MKEFEYLFKVKTLEAGQRGRYQDSYYSYEVTSNCTEYKVKQFCMNVLQKSYEKKDMPNPFAGELLEFKKLTDNNKNVDMFNSTKEETYLYKTKELYCD
jgi:hypothetical protein